MNPDTMRAIRALLTSVTLPSRENLSYYGTPYDYRATSGMPVLGGAVDLTSPQAGGMLFERLGGPAMRLLERMPQSSEIGNAYRLASGTPSIQTSILGQILRQDPGRMFGGLAPALRDPSSILLAQALQQRLVGGQSDPTGGVSPGINIADITGEQAEALFDRNKRSSLGDRQNALAALQGQIGVEREAFNARTLRNQTARPFGELAHPALNPEFTPWRGVQAIIQPGNIQTLGMPPADLPPHLQQVADRMRVMRGLYDPRLRTGLLNAATPNMQNLPFALMQVMGMDPAEFTDLDPESRLNALQKGVDALRNRGQADLDAVDLLAGPDPDGIPRRYDPEQVTERPRTVLAGASREGKATLADIEIDPELENTRERGRMQAADRRGLRENASGVRNPVPYGTGDPLERRLNAFEEAGAKGSVPLNKAASVGGSKSKRTRAVRDTMAQRQIFALEGIADDLSKTAPDNPEVARSIEAFKAEVDRFKGSNLTGKKRQVALGRVGQSLMDAVNNHPQMREYRPLAEQLVAKFGTQDSMSDAARGREQVPTAYDDQYKRERSQDRSIENAKRRAQGTRMREIEPGSGQFEQVEIPKPVKDQGRLQGRAIALLRDLGLTRGSDFVRSRIMDVDDPVQSQRTIKRGIAKDSAVFGGGELGKVIAALTSGTTDLGLTTNEKGRSQGDPERVLRSLGFSQDEITALSRGTADVDGVRAGRSFEQKLDRAEAMVKVLRSMDSTDVGELQRMVGDYSKGKVTLAQLRESAENMARKNGQTFFPKTTSKATGIGHSAAGKPVVSKDGPVSMPGRLVKGRGGGSGMAYEFSVKGTTYKGTLDEIATRLAENDPTLQEAVKTHGYDKTVGKLKSSLEAHFRSNLRRGGRMTARADGGPIPNTRAPRTLEANQDRALGDEAQSRAIKNADDSAFVNRIVERGSPRRNKKGTVTLTRKEFERLFNPRTGKANNRLIESVLASAKKDRVTVFLPDGQRLVGKAKVKPRAMGDMSERNRNRYMEYEKPAKDIDRDTWRRIVQEIKATDQDSEPRSKPAPLTRKQRLRNYKDKASQATAPQRANVDLGLIDMVISRMGNAIKSVRGNMPARVR